ncbi:fatty acyl-AMP ligase [Egbenema bharatensis]|uniref:fatty acyl-AMP ligase n=1 Tax=Egbenema bharatensis TaxID=3463334 RepID=UPI003A87F5A8
MLLFPPSLEYIAAFFGCLYAGVIAVPAYPPRPNRSLQRLQSIAADAQASIALTVSTTLTSLKRQLAQTLEQAAPELQNLHWFATDAIPNTLAQDWQPPIFNPDALAFLQYTSGSTAAPKGAMITHRNLLYNLDLIYEYFGHSADSIGVLWLPLYHDMGLVGGVLQSVYAGFPVTLMSPLVFLQSPIRWLRAISHYRATTSGGPNFAYDFCVRKITSEQRSGLDLSSWTVALNAAEPIRPETLERFTATFAPCGFRRSTFFPSYGMAEATLMVSGGLHTDEPVLKTVQATGLAQHQVIPANADDHAPDHITNHGIAHTTDHAAHPPVENATDQDNSHGTSLQIRTLVSCGKTLRDQQIVIVHPETLSRCAANQVGEIWVAGDSVAKGYWGNLEATKRDFHAYLADTGEGPFLRTGDLGFLDQGELFVTGRLKDVIIINGHNYYPQDIETTVELCSEAIRPTCCAAFSVDLHNTEQLIVLAEVDRRYFSRTSGHPQTAKNSSQPNVKDITQAIRRSVLKQHDLQVSSVVLLKPGTIPKTSSGKIQRHACRDLFLKQNLTEIEIPIHV